MLINSFITSIKARWKKSFRSTIFPSISNNFYLFFFFLNIVKVRQTLGIGKNFNRTSTYTPPLLEGSVLPRHESGLTDTLLSNYG